MATLATALSLAAATLAAEVSGLAGLGVGTLAGLTGFGVGAGFTALGVLTIFVVVLGAAGFFSSVADFALLSTRAETLASRPLS